MQDKVAVLRRRAVPTGLACVLIGATAMLAACGDDSSSDEGEAVTPEKLELAKERTREGSQQPTEIGITEPLKELPQRGIDVAMLSATSATFLNYINHIKDAYGLLGFDVEVFSFGDTQDSLRGAVSSAVAADPTGVIINNLPLEFRTEETEAWKDQGLPILANGSTDENDKNLVNYINGDIVGENTQRAVDWIISDADGEEVNLLFVTDDTLPCCSTQAPYVEERLKEYCPSCGFEKMVIQLADVGGKVPGQVVSYLQANPETNYGLFLLGDYAVGVPAALKAAGLEDQFKFCSTSGTPVNYQYIQSGQEACDVAYDQPSSAYMGADLFARVLAGQPIQENRDWRQPVQIITEDNITWPIDQPYPGLGEEGVEKWKQLWGL
jgi:ribose transport system substrate-binding protein